MRLAEEQMRLAEEQKLLDQLQANAEKMAVEDQIEKT
jgi:hypothetical protein